MTYPHLKVSRVAAPVRQQVYEQLREAIVNMGFSAGQRLIEREIAESTGVSRPTIREALQQLVTEGLVATIPGKGWVVAVPTQEEAEDLYSVRALLEGLAGRRFVERATSADEKALLAAYEDVKATLSDSNDVAVMMDAKASFYDAFFTGAHSETVVTLISGLHARITGLRSRTLAQPGRPQESVAEIGKIVDALVARNAAAVERACATHVRRAAATVFAALKAEKTEAS